MVVRIAYRSRRTSINLHNIWLILTDDGYDDFNNCHLIRFIVESLAGPVAVCGEYTEARDGHIVHR